MPEEVNEEVNELEQRSEEIVDEKAVESSTEAAVETTGVPPEDDEATITPLEEATKEPAQTTTQTEPEEAAAETAEPVAAPQEPPPPPEPEPVAGIELQEVTEQDKLMAFLSYVIGFLVPAVVLLSVDMRERRYQKIHATQSLGLWSASIVFYAALALIDVVLAQIPCLGWLLACISLPLYLLPPIMIFYYALLASQGREFDIPFLSDTMREQGWI